MANLDHVRWLREGVVNWNARRNKSDFKPDLSGANLSGANLSGANLRKCNFTGAKIYRADLTGSNLEGASFAMAKPWKAILDKEAGDARVVEKGKIVSIAELIDKCKKLKNCSQLSCESRDVIWYYRGQRCFD